MTFQNITFNRLPRCKDADKEKQEYVKSLRDELDQLKNFQNDIFNYIKRNYGRYETYIYPS